MVGLIIGRRGAIYPVACHGEGTTRAKSLGPPWPRERTTWIECRAGRSLSTGVNQWSYALGERKEAAGGSSVDGAGWGHDWPLPGRWRVRQDSPSKTRS